MFLIDDLMLLPLKGLIAVANHIHNHLTRELDDTGTIRRRLLELRLRYELDDLDEETYRAEEAVLLHRYRAAAERRLGLTGEGEGSRE